MHSLKHAVRALAKSPALVLVAVGAMLLGVTAIASFIPARRAARLDPMTILRKE